MDEDEAASGVPENMRDHLIVCGMGHVGYRIAELLRELCEPFVIISREIRSEWTDILKQGGVRHLIGDARSESCLREAGIEHAKGILIVTSNDLVNIQIAADAQRLNPTIGLIVRVFDHDLAERIGREMGVRDVLSPALLTAPVFVAAALGDEMLRAFTIDDCGIDVLRLTFTAHTPGLGEMLDEFCARRDLIPLAVRYETGLETLSALNTDTLRDRSKTADTAPAPGVTIRLKRPLMVGDEIVVLTFGGVTERLRRGGYLPFHAAPTSNRLPRLLMRLLHHPFAPLSALSGRWRRAPRFLRLAFSSLIAVLTLSAVVFHYAMPIPWVDAFYFVISIMTTVGFGDYNLRESPAWLKIFGCFVMLAGAALVAIVFGIITDFIVSARVDRALGRRQSDLANHLVVIGLGDVGTRVSEALRRMKQPLVVIERNIDHEAVPSLAEDLYVIVGDANRQQVMEQANMAQARAVIVTTPDDLDNLRIAHLAERHNPNVRSVVRIYDSMLATKLVSSMGIDRAVNAAAIAAATFVACTINARTEHGFLLNGRLLLLRWMLPEEIARQGLVGASIQELRLEGLAVILSRVGTGMFQRTLPVSSDSLVGRGESLLVLEEYNPDLRACEPPSLQSYSDSAAL